MKIYDVSVPISPATPVWPGDPAVVLEKVSSMDAGARRQCLPPGMRRSYRHPRGRAAPFPERPPHRGVACTGNPGRSGAGDPDSAGCKAGHRGK